MYNNSEKFDSNLISDRELMLAILRNQSVLNDKLNKFEHLISLFYDDKFNKDNKYHDTYSHKFGGSHNRDDIETLNHLLENNRNKNRGY